MWAHLNGTRTSAEDPDKNECGGFAGGVFSDEREGADFSQSSYVSRETSSFGLLKKCWFLQFGLGSLGLIPLGYSE
jgi:hypothetical protein